MCRADGRRCDHKWDHSARERANQRRRERYAAAKGGTVRSYARTVETADSGLSPMQEEFFANSKARNADGSLLKVYHGTDTDFDSFDPNSLGRGNDSWGNGFYLTSSQGTAEQYASDPENVKEFYIDLQNPMRFNGANEGAIDDVVFSRDDVIQILKSHPDVYLQPDEDDERESFLSDFSPEYWERNSHSPEEFDRMIEKVADEHFEGGTWTHFESLYGKENGQAWLKTLNKVTGHDGVVVDFGDLGSHYIAWFPEQVKLTSNESPNRESAAF